MKMTMTITIMTMTRTSMTTLTMKSTIFGLPANFVLTSCPTTPLGQFFRSSRCERRDPEPFKFFLNFKTFFKTFEFSEPELIKEPLFQIVEYQYKTENFIYLIDDLEYIFFKVFCFCFTYYIYFSTLCKYST